MICRLKVIFSKLKDATVAKTKGVGMEHMFSLSFFFSQKRAIFTEIASDKHPEWIISARILKKLDRSLSWLYSVLKQHSYC